MITTLIAAAAFVVAAMLLIFVHELGHFAVAKELGIRVQAFAVGFGRVLWHQQWGEKDYRLCALPFGGYVSLAGEDLNATTGPRDFTGRPIWQRAAVAVAGVTMNLITALLIVWGVFMSYGVHTDVNEYTRVDARDAVAMAGTVTASITTQAAAGVAGLASRQISAREVSGPLTVAKLAAEALWEGLDAYLVLLAIVCVNLAIVNLLPIPGLDGGLLALLGLEAVRGRPLSAPVGRRVLIAGVSAITLWSLFAVANDVLKLAVVAP